VARRKGYSLYSEAKEGNIFAVIRWRQIWLFGNCYANN
jgi:hypothetical protein